MIDLKNPEAFRIVLYFVVPGLIAVFFRAQFLSGRIQKHTDAILTYVAVSLVYWATLTACGYSPSDLTGKSVASLFFILVGPMIFGCLLGLNIRRDYIRNLLRRLNINTVHAVSTAWDWKFSRTEPRFVIVHMTNGKKFGGLFSGNSFASSDPSERDIFLEEVYSISASGVWKELHGREVLIRPSDISSIEFIRIENGD
ncbi:hypothetical protein KUV57_12720 [Epibacterium sp. DP7N7-1]|nr:hypothetical protein [Epibacterium sp. DP7N7-1]